MSYLQFKYPHYSQLLSAARRCSSSATLTTKLRILTPTLTSSKHFQNAVSVKEGSARADRPQSGLDECKHPMRKGPRKAEAIWRGEPQVASCSLQWKVRGQPSPGGKLLFSTIVLVYKTGKISESRKIIWNLCHVHRNKSLSKSHYGDDISDTKRGKMRNNKIEKQKTNRRKSKSKPIASQSVALNRENIA